LHFILFSLGDLSFATTEYGYKVVHRNFFETSHAKGSQDAAGGFIKRLSALFEGSFSGLANRF
jgi:hypothetical protein